MLSTGLYCVAFRNAWYSEHVTCSPQQQTAGRHVEEYKQKGGRRRVGVVRKGTTTLPRGMGCVQEAGCVCLREVEARGTLTHRVLVNIQATLGQLGVVLLAGSHFPPVLHIDAHSVIPLNLHSKALQGGT